MGMSDAEIYRKHKDDLVRYSAAPVGPDRAEDVVATVVARVLARRSLSDLDEPRPYLFRAVLNEARSELRRKEPPILLPVHRAPDVPQPEVVAAVAALPVRQRAATFLVYWADMSVADAANHMGARTGTVKRYLHLARAHLREALDDDH